MVDIAIVLLSMGMQLLLMPRDKQPWTPTFKGDRLARYEQAVAHYQVKMGLEREYTIVARVQQHRPYNEKAGQFRCAWVDVSDIWDADTIGIDLAAKGCDRFKPELLALHEQCHRRLAHLSMPEVDSKKKHDEVQGCMVAYAAKERR